MTHHGDYELDEVDFGPEADGLPKNERDYIIPAADAKGQSARVQCRVQPSYMRLLSEVVQSKRYPFRVQGDALRWCVVTGLKKLAGGAGITSVIAQADMILEMLRDEEYQLQFTENFQAMKRVVDRYIERGAPGKARELLARIRQQIAMMPEGYWKEQYAEELSRKYGSLIDGDGTAKLLLTDDE